MKFGANELEAVEFQRAQNPKLHPPIPIWNLDERVEVKQRICLHWDFASKFEMKLEIPSVGEEGWDEFCAFGPSPQFQLLETLWVAVSSTVGLRVEHRHHLQSVCLQDVIIVDQTDENRLGLSLVNILEANTLKMMTTFNTKPYCG
ncbi:hypothetical protein AVEN_187026-1 [Araneus ventricosus]|uniref:Uncharacterized protein n=1 Tax=Araneus ventricosus TaxID=182803 RepID=A0A4Y2HBF7_ARAVE|nr:hypothetical protein AVEN_187026-1 [Araneus ventricosus]